METAGLTRLSLPACKMDIFSSFPRVLEVQGMTWGLRNSCQPWFYVLAGPWGADWRGPGWATSLGRNLGCRRYRTVKENVGDSSMKQPYEIKLRLLARRVHKTQ